MHLSPHRLQARHDVGRQQLEHAPKALLGGIEAKWKHHQSSVEQLGQALHALSPLNTLSRGYAVITRRSDGALLTSAKLISSRTAVKIRLHEGQLDGHVEPSPVLPTQVQETLAL